MLDPFLKAAFRKEELELAASIGAAGGPLGSSILELFSSLPDPLLSAEDVRSLLGVPADQAEQVNFTLLQLCTEKSLEKSTATLRPFDPEGITLYRRAGVAAGRLKLIATETDLGNGTTRLHFSCNGRVVRSIAKIDRLDSIAGTGNQREEIRKHVENIADGIRHGTQIPNSVLLVLLEGQISAMQQEDSADPAPESFISIRPISDDWITIGMPGTVDAPVQRIRHVEIDFPYRRAAFDDEKSAILVDGQQRTAALSLVDIDDVSAFVLSVSAVIANEEQAKRVFQVANSTVKISTQFSRALLATMDEAPGYLRQERVKALAAKRLAITDKTSPFAGLVQYAGVKSAKSRPPVAYNSLFQVISIFAESGLPLEDKPGELAMVIAKSFAIVKRTWPDAWGVKPTESRLMHGVGLRAMASILAHKLESEFSHCGDINSPELWQHVADSIGRLKSRVIWTDAAAGDASPAVRKIWREQISNRQNTNQDISALTSFLKKESLDLDTKAHAK